MQNNLRIGLVASLLCQGAMLLSGCVRVDLENAAEEVSSEALRISQSDAVVLCPISAAPSADGGLSVVWAGYPPADDRLQLMYATFLANGEMQEKPASIAFLNSELAGLQVSSNANGVLVELVEEEEKQRFSIQLDQAGTVTNLQQNSANHLSFSEAREWTSGLCQSTVVTENAQFYIFQSPVDGELPLWVERSTRLP